VKFPLFASTHHPIQWPSGEESRKLSKGIDHLSRYDSSIFRCRAAFSQNSDLPTASQSKASPVISQSWRFPRTPYRNERDHDFVRSTAAEKVITSYRDV
jgi:hypothetical protein